MFKTFKNAFDVTSTAGSSDAAGAFEAMSKAFKAAMASGQKPSFSDINAALAGGDILETWKAFYSSFKISQRSRNILMQGLPDGLLLPSTLEDKRDQNFSMGLINRRSFRGICSKMPPPLTPETQRPLMA